MGIGSIDDIFTFRRSFMISCPVGTRKELREYFGGNGLGLLRLTCSRPSFNYPKKI